MKKTLFFCVTLFLFGFSCGDNQNNTLPEELQAEIETKNTSHLTGTEWKLAGIVDVQTGNLTELEPKDCKKCYTLTFDTDHTASGYSVSSRVTIDLFDLDKYMLTHEGEFWDGDKFREAIVSIESFSVTSDELKLSYNKKKNYLLFKLIQL